MNTETFAALATGAEPAGGAAVGEAIGATAAAGVATALIALLISWHRSGRIDWLARAAAAARRATGLPEWAALPVLVLNASLLTAVLGMYWDISLHIDNGRDPGPLANPAHYLILVGLYGVLLAGVLSAALAADRPSRTAISLGAGWWAPVGGALIAVCGAFALSGFPLDDLWHRLFGQDVTLWGPTHLMLIGGASLATLGALALQSEAIGELGRDPESSRRGAFVVLRRSLLAGSFLVALSTFQGEFDFGVPQFREVLQPVLIMLAAGIGLVTARIYLGRGGALMAVLGFLVIRGLVALMVGVVWGQTTPHFPLYLAEAVLVEAAFAGARAALAGRHRDGRGSPDRHDRAGRGVGLEPRLDAAALDRLAAPRGRDRGLRDGGGRRGARRVHRRVAAGPDARARASAAHPRRPPGRAGGVARAGRRGRLGPADGVGRPGQRPRHADRRALRRRARGARRPSG